MNIQTGKRVTRIVGNLVIHFQIAWVQTMSMLNWVVGGWGTDLIRIGIIVIVAVKTKILAVVDPFQIHLKMNVKIIVIVEKDRFVIVENVQ